MFDIYVVHDLLMLNIPYAKLYHMHIALNHVDLTQNIKIYCPTYYQTFIAEVIRLRRSLERTWHRDRSNTEVYTLFHQQQ